MQNYSKAAAGNYSFEIDRPSGIDPKATLGYEFRLPDTGHWQSSVIDLMPTNKSVP
ncbi:MAG TPA: hypothetical protein VIJ25_04015 [Methylococcales bacterium]|jgi:hypothetical protein